MKLKPDVPYAEGEPLKDLEAKLGRGHYKRLPVVTGREDNTLSLVTSGRETFVTLLENFKGKILLSRRQVPLHMCY